jgi:hypothetical protein
MHDALVDEMTDFLCQMQIATLEETPLYEIPKGSVDLVRGGPVHHGPWPAAACAAVLKVWHAAGWIGLHFPGYPSTWNLTPADWGARIADGDTLTGLDADELLDHPERWILGQADGHVCLYQTETGRMTPWQQWYDVALETAQRLPLREHEPER